MKSEDRRVIPLQAQKMEVIGRLASAIIHDLNNLLTVIQLNASLIESGGFEADEILPAAGKIVEASQRAADLTRKVLKFARRHPDELRDFKIGDLFDGLVRLLEPLIAKRVEVDIVIGPDACWVRGDRSAIEQAILNLVLNSVDAMPSGGKITLSCEERDLETDQIEGCAAGRFVMVCVADCGCGISPEERETIFEPFFTKKFSGTGMGLAIVRRVAELHRGAVDFDSEPGRGTEFRLWLPATQAPAGEPEVAKIISQNKRMTGTVLLVEDDASIRDLARQLLETDGLAVIVAATGEEALEVWRARRGEIDMLFTDLVLPGELSGRNVALEVLKDNPNLPVLYTSGYSGAWSDRSFFTKSNFLPKPFHPEELRQAMMAVMAAP